MFQVYDPKQMLVRWAVLDEIRLARCKAMARRRPSNRLRAPLIVEISALSRQTRSKYKSMAFGKLQMRRSSTSRARSYGFERSRSSARRELGETDFDSTRFR
jgi:hypothetical protein